MNALARGLARALFAIGTVTLLVGLVLVGVSLYLGTWPLRRLAGKTATGAKVAAVQELLAAVAGAAAVFRR